MLKANNPIEKARQFQRTLYRAAKRNATRRFHALYDKIYRKDILRMAWQMVKAHKGSAGVDNQTIQSIEEGGVEAFLAQIQAEIKEGRYRPKPVRRVNIPKADGRLRPLGIPAISDRVVQGAMKIVLEPLFEADFKPCSFGFRPKKSAHEANEAIRQAANRGCDWVLDADIRDYFNTIDQEKLMVLVGRRVSDRRMLKLIRKFLKAGVFEDGEVRSTNTGTPQGGVLSPLLANIYLNYLDKIWEEKCSQVGVLVRYADDFVALCRSKWNAEEALRRVKYLTGRLGLELHPDKTKVVNLKEGKEGFDFLGFHHRKLRAQKSGKYYLMCWPRAKARKAIQEKIKAIIGERRQRLCRTLKEVIEELNPVLKGWGNYFAVGNSSGVFAAVDNFVRAKLCLFLSKKHGKSGRGWVQRWKDIDFGGLGLHKLSGTVRWYRHSTSANGRRASESRVR